MSKQKDTVFRTGKDLSIRVKWVIFICLAIFLAIGVTVITNYLTVSKILKKDNASYSETNAYNAAEQVTLNLAKYETSIEQLTTAIDADSHKSLPIKQIETLIKGVQVKNESLISVYFMDFTTGKIHMSPHANLDIDVRDTKTYNKLLKNTHTQWMDVYEDKEQKKIMTSIVAPVVLDGKMLGAVGYDIDLSSIGEIRKEVEGQSGTELIILDAQGFVVSSFMKNVDGKNMNPAKSKTVEGVEDIFESQKKFQSTFNWVEDVYNKENGSLDEFVWEGENYTGVITTIPQLNWKVISFTNNKVFASKISKVNKAGIISIIIGLFIGTLCALFLAEKLKKIIARFQKVIGKTTQGDLVTELVVDSKDEIGNLSLSYNEMLHNMRRLINKVLANAESIQQATGGLSVIANENSTAIAEVSKSIEEISKGAGNQSEEIEKGAAVVLDLSMEIEELTKLSAAIEQEVNEASEQITYSNQKVRNLEVSNDNLETAFKKVTEMIIKLSDQSKTISNVTYTIAQIAEQTNLLSLNASIEAARAGEHGKGFSVVANEVRKLAEESKTATDNIQMIINGVLVDTNELVEVMSKTNQISAEQKGAVKTVSASIDQLTDSLAKIMISVENKTVRISTIQEHKDIVTAMIENVSNISKETTAFSEEIASAMEEQSASTNEVAYHSGKLSTLVQDLNKAVDQFNIGK